MQREVKAANRKKREGYPPSALPALHASPRGVAPGSSHKPRRPSAREHRTAAGVHSSHTGVAPLSAWERQYRGLEEVFGADLGGLSGLVLAADTRL